MINHHDCDNDFNYLIVWEPPQRIQVPRPPRVEQVRLLGHQGWSVAEVPVGSTVPGNIFNFHLLQRMEFGGVLGAGSPSGWLALGWTILLMQAHHLLKGGLQLSGTCLSPKQSAFSCHTFSEANNPSIFYNFVQMQSLQRLAKILDDCLLFSISNLVPGCYLGWFRGLVSCCYLGFQTKRRLLIQSHLCLT